MHGLLDLAPHTASRVRATVVSRRSRPPALEAGDVVVVRQRERIAADAIVLSGASDVDQAIITGEPLPVNMMVGDEVFAGRTRCSRGH